jgi:hypothetical protein
MSMSCGGFGQPIASVGVSVQRQPIRLHAARCPHLHGLRLTLHVFELARQLSGMNGIGDEPGDGCDKREEQTEHEEPACAAADGSARRFAGFLLFVLLIEAVFGRPQCRMGGARRNRREDARFAVFERPARKPRFEPNGNRQAVQELRMLEAVLLELAGLPHRQFAGQVAIDDVFAFDVTAIHFQCRLSVASSTKRGASAQECAATSPRAHN